MRPPAWAVRRPQTTEEAQYSLPYPVAAALVRGRLGAAEVTAPFDDPDILRLADAIEMGEDEDMNRVFPAQRLAQVALRLVDGRRLASSVVPARGDPEEPLSTEELAAKFHDLADPVLGPVSAAAIEAAVFGPDADAGWVDSDPGCPPRLRRRARLAVVYGVIGPAIAKSGSGSGAGRAATA